MPMTPQPGSGFQLAGPATAQTAFQLPMSSIPNLPMTTEESGVIAAPPGAFNTAAAPTVAT